MKNEIAQVIKRLEAEKNINVVLACETGSRAWGFPSPDSDYDVRLIYTHDIEWYMALFEGKDSVEYMSEDGEIDLTGWEFRKALRLLWKSNPSLLERLQSPMIYSQNDLIMTELRSVAQSFYSKRATLHHYLSLAKKSLDDCSNDTYRLKTFFYALRASCACRYIFKHDDSPPILFDHMLEKVDMKVEYVDRVRELVRMKAELSESYLHVGESDLLTWMKQALQKSEADASSLDVSHGDVKELDALLSQSIG